MRPRLPFSHGAQESKAQAPACTMVSRSAGPTCTPHGSGCGAARALLLDAPLRVQGYQPDRRSAHPVVAEPCALGQLHARAHLSWLSISSVFMEQRVLCRLGQPWNGAFIGRGGLW